jgi:nicotinamidase-related amidase
MSAPKTLLEMAGAPRTPAKLHESVLVLVDCQLEYVSGRLPLVGIEEALAQARTLLAMARDARTPVIHVVHHGAPGGLFDPQGETGQIAPEVTARPGETIVPKRLPNAFAGTTLQNELTRIGRKQLVIAGFQTHMCVSSTVRAALDLGYRTTVVAGAVATRDLPSPSAGVIRAAELHGATLAALADRFAIVVARPDALG